MSYNYFFITFLLRFFITFFICTFLRLLWVCWALCFDPFSQPLAALVTQGNSVHIRKAVLAYRSPAKRTHVDLFRDFLRSSLSGQTRKCSTLPNSTANCTGQRKVSIFAIPVLYKMVYQ